MARKGAASVAFLIKSVDWCQGVPAKLRHASRLKQKPPDLEYLVLIDLLLHKADVKRPYVLVAASAGGPLARVFAREYRNEFAGMVLVDSTDPNTVQGRKVNGMNVNFRVREDSKGRTVPPVQTLQSSPLGPLTAEEQERYDRVSEETGGKPAADLPSA